MAGCGAWPRANIKHTASVETLCIYSRDFSSFSFLFLPFFQLSLANRTPLCPALLAVV